MNFFVLISDFKSVERCSEPIGNGYRYRAEIFRVGRAGARYLKLLYDFYYGGHGIGAIQFFLFLPP